MSDNPFFSIILPLHNSAGFMRAMLDSIRSQSFTDYELIAICDRCSDNTAEIAREYTDKVLEVDFGNAGPTRNAGLDIAKGKWILFSDDDDWWLHDYVFETLHHVLDGDENSDFLAYGFIWKQGEKNVNVPFLQENGSWWVAPWTKAWRRSFIGDHRFPENWKHSDDLGFAEEMFPLVKDWSYLTQPLYYYNYMHKGSIQDKLRTGELSKDDMRG